jgi:hypothetical protein
MVISLQSVPASRRNHWAERQSQPVSGKPRTSQAATTVAESRGALVVENLYRATASDMCVVVGSRARQSVTELQPIEPVYVVARTGAYRELLTSAQVSTELLQRS